MSEVPERGRLSVNVERCDNVTESKLRPKTKHDFSEPSWTEKIALDRNCDQKLSSTLSEDDRSQIEASRYER